MADDFRNWRAYHAYFGSTAASGAAAAAGGSFNLKLGHNLAEDHAVHIQLTSFAEQVKEKTNGTVNIQIIPNGTLSAV